MFSLADHSEKRPCSNLVTVFNPTKMFDNHFPITTSALLVALIAFLAYAEPANAQPVTHTEDPGSDAFPSVRLSSAGSTVAAPYEPKRWTPIHSDPFCRTNATGWDRRGLQVLYCVNISVVTKSLSLAHHSAYPVFYTAVPAAWGGAWMVRGTDDFSDAYRLTLTQGATYLTVIGLKRMFQRPRPFMTVRGISSRSSDYGRAIADGQYASLPSGHAGLSVALATSWSLSHPRWYVIAPAALWSGAVSLSRLHLGVHYPTDILIGAVLGAGVATGIHLLRDAVTPAGLKPDHDGDSTPDVIDPAAGIATGPMVALFRARL